MVRSVPSVVLACLPALTVDGHLWSPFHTGGAVEEVCRLSQVQVSSMEGCFFYTFFLFFLDSLCRTSVILHYTTTCTLGHRTAFPPPPHSLLTCSP